MEPLQTLRPLLGTLALLIWALVPLGAGSAKATRWQATLCNDAPNTRDYDRIERGYYERLIEEQPTRQAAPVNAGVLAQTVDDIREYVLRPHLSTTHKGATWTTNDLGMRDLPYPTAKPPGSFRVALVGDSIASGWGVNDGQGFEPRVEQTWNQRSLQGNGPTIEVLNFAVPGHAPGQRWDHFTRIGWSTSPDLVIVESTLADLGWDERRLRALIPRGLGFEAAVYQTVLNRSGITAADDLKARLRPFREAILAGVYQKVVSDCHQRGIQVVWILLPRVGKKVIPDDREKLTSLARSSGFDRVIDLSDTFDGQAATSLAIAPDDFHPNVLGHTQLAHRLDAELGPFVSSRAFASRPWNRECHPDADRLGIAPPSLSEGVDPQ